MEISFINTNLLCYCCSVTKLGLALCNSMDCSTPGFPLLYFLPEFVQTHVIWVDDAIRPSHPLLPLYPLRSRVGCAQGLWWSGLLNLMSFPGPLNLASGGFLDAPSLISNSFCPLELRKGHGGWSLTYEKWGTERPLCPGGPRGPVWHQKGGWETGKLLHGLQGASPRAISLFLFYVC